MILIDIRREESRLDVSGGAIIVSRAPAFVPAAFTASDTGAADTRSPSGAAEGVIDLTRREAPDEVFQAPEITIVTRLGKVIVEEGSLALRDDGRQVSVVVNAGTAQLSTAAGRSTLGVAKSATIEDTGEVVETAALFSTLPAQGFEILSASDVAFVDFEWMAPIGFELVLSAAPAPLRIRPRMITYEASIVMQLACLWRTAMVACGWARPRATSDTSREPLASLG